MVYTVLMIIFALNQNNMTPIEWLETRLPKTVVEHYSCDIDYAKVLERDMVINARITAPVLPTPYSDEYKQEAERYFETLKKINQ